MIKTFLINFWSRFSYLLYVIYQFLVKLLFCKEETPCSILRVTESDKYSAIKRAYRKQLFRYKSTIDKNNSDMTRKILEAYEVLKRKESIYVDDSYFDEDFYKRTGECLSNLEANRIIVDENNIREIYGRFCRKYKQLVQYLKRKEMAILMPKTHYVKTEYKVAKKPKTKKEKAYKCTICKKEYQQKTKYVEHMNGNKHRNMCKEMGLEVDVATEARSQINNERKKRRKPKKDHDEEVSKVEKREVNSMAGTSTFVEPHHFLFCSFCEKRFPSRKELTQHLQKH
ncbi:hypothetical protein VCUG_01470 [Vavraia culicis subsp. floridensis]|uniref:C2H2-type domain-containing protein n=1 Tax=Vavraia culicis (isolate floridensis) TaxID=948595 RepID=L2GVA6_VAVCU|nr:uncharacterized protein VCUG_01470 [Vavraia culicis subsp. floridensis]ELA47025.1 hypothetical protein VCUG_01470 [Vavraia culicis subsp. floridensis]